MNDGAEKVGDTCVKVSSGIQETSTKNFLGDMSYFRGRVGVVYPPPTKKKSTLLDKM